MSAQVGSVGLYVSHPGVDSSREVLSQAEEHLELETVVSSASVESGVHDSCIQDRFWFVSLLSGSSHHLKCQGKCLINSRKVVRKGSWCQNRQIRNVVDSIG